MSALVFVRDGRTLPFVPVTIAALEAIRATCKEAREGGGRRSYPHALATYMALLEFANDDRTDRVAITHAGLVDRAGASPSTIKAAIGDLRTAGVLQVVERFHGTAQIANEYVVVEPDAESNNPGRQKTDPRSSENHPTRARESGLEDLQEEGVGENARTRPKINGKPANDETWRRTLHALAEFNRQAGKRMLPTTGSGEPSEAAKRIYSRLASWPNLSDEQITDVIRRTLSSRWWGSDPPVVGVIFGPKVFEENLSRDGTPASSNGKLPAGVTPIRRGEDPKDAAMAERMRTLRIAAARGRGEVQ